MSEPAHIRESFEPKIAEPEIPVSEIMALDRVLGHLGSSWNELCASAEQVVLFGSRACDCANERSDWDLLCIGEGTTRLTRSLDVIWLPTRAMSGKQWLESELAGHVGAFGRWLVGQKTWWPAPAAGAATAKARRIGQKLRSMEESWALLSRSFRKKHWIRLRRDLQRHELLCRGQVVMPSAWLDDAWRRCEDPLGRCLELYALAGQKSGFFETVVVPEVT